MAFGSLGVLLQACGFASLNTGDWIGINTLVVLLGITVAAFIYALANFLTVERREKLKGYVRYEILEAAFSAIILVSLILIASFACSAGGLLYGQSGYTGLFASSDTYVGNLLFVSGLSALGNIFTVGTQYTVISNIAQGISAGYLESISENYSVPVLGGYASISPDTKITDLFTKFSALFFTLVDTMAISFGGLFILFVMLPIISATALTVVAPTALLMRSLSFMGPQLRRTSNLFLAMAIGFYFVLPLMIGTNAYVASCLNIYASPSQPSCNYPFFPGYTGPYTLFSVSTSSLFGSGATYPLSSSNLPSFANGISVPLSFFGSAFLSTSGLGQLFTIIFNGPQLAAQYASATAAYVFMGIIMVALDLGVTVGFIMGIARGLDSLGRFSGGSFFGG